MALAYSVAGKFGRLELREVRLDNISSSGLLCFRLEPEESNDFVELVESIRKHGLIQPILVREMASQNDQCSSSASKRYEIVSGHRRYLACKKIGFPSILCSVAELSDKIAFQMALVENIQRQSLDPIEEAEAFKMYVVNFGRGGISELATKIGKSEEYVSHRLLLLGLPDQIIKRIRRRLLKASEATELVWLRDPQRQMDLVDQIEKRNLSFRQTRKAVRLLRHSSLSVHDSVERVLNDNDAHLEPIDVVSGIRSINSWTSCQIRGRLADEKIMNQAILNLRTCLAGFDLLVEKSEVQGTRELIMRERQEIHRALDHVISHKVTLMKANLHA